MHKVIDKLRTPKLNLALKGLVLIALPGLLQLLLLFSFNDLIQKAEYFEQRQNHYKNVIGRTNWLSTLVLTMNFSWLGALETNDRRMRSVYNWCVEQFPEELAQINALSQGDDKQSFQVQTLASQISDLTQLLKSNETTSDSVKRASLLQEQILPTWEKLNQTRSQLLALEKSRSKVDETMLPKFRAQRKLMLISFAVFDVFSAVILMYFYTRTITSRLALLADNARLFGEHKSTHKPLKGTDEVAQLDNEMHRMMNELLEAEKRKQEYVQMISHDLRTPLTTVLASLYLISEHGNLSQETRPILGQAERNLQRLLHLINQLLQMEKMQAGKISPECERVSTSAIIDKAFDGVLSQAEEHNITLKRPQTDHFVFAEEELIVQVLVNLLGNALKFSPSPSEIVVDTNESEKFVEFRVIDQGRGIPESHIHSIFERFQQVEKSDATKKGGSGLGLAICKAIVEAHHGKIGVRSIEGAGSTFWFKLPKENVSNVHAPPML